MRISIVTGAFTAVPPAPCGAVERRWFGVAGELARRGHQVVMVGRAFKGLPARSDFDGVRVIRHTEFVQTGNVVVDLLKDSIYALRLLRKVPPSDVVIVNDFWFPVACSLFRRDKVIVNVARVPKGQLFLYRAAAGIIVPSEAMREAVLKEGIAESRVIRIGNPIDVDVFTPLATRRFQPPHKLLFAGRIHPEKGLSILIESVAELVKHGTPIECRIVGPYLEAQGGGGIAYKNHLRSLATGLPIEFVEPVFEPRILADLYRWADFFVYPSIAERGESFGVAPVEAMGTGAIPIVSDLRCFDEFMRTGVGERFDHRSASPAQELTRAIQRAFSSRDLVSLSNRSAEVASEYSYPNIAGRVVSAIHHFCGEPDRK